MSNQFESLLTDWFHQKLEQIDPEMGSRYAAIFPEADITTEFVRQVLDRGKRPPVQVEITREGETDTVTGITTESGKVLLCVSVARSPDDVDQDFEVSRGYATTIRNQLADGNFDEETALLMAYESGAEIETLETTYQLFVEDELLPLSRFKAWLDDQTSEFSDPARAVVRVVDEELQYPDNPMENLDPLRTFCQIWSSCESEDGDQLSKSIPKIGTFLREENFEKDWFEKTAEYDHLTSQAEDILNKNRAHAKRIKDARSVTNDPHSVLAGNYGEEFIQTVIEADPWHAISHSTAASGEISHPGPESSGEPFERGKSVDPGSREKPQLEDIEFGSDHVKPFGGGKERTGERHILVSGEDGHLEAEFKYSADVSEEPIEFLDDSGEDLTTTEAFEVDGNSINIKLAGYTRDDPHYYSLRVYIGHKAKRGHPENLFNIAILPKWFFDSLGDDPFDVNIEKEALDAVGGHVSLRPPEHEEDEEIRKEISNEEELIELDRNLYIEPGSVPKIERLKCLIVKEDETPITLQFITDVEDPVQDTIQFPLSFAAITDPEDWADQNLRPSSAIVSDTKRGEFHSAPKGLIEIPDEDKRLLELEDAIVQQATPAPRMTDQEELVAGIAQDEEISNVSEDLLTAYQALFSHFQEEETTPSIDRWDVETCNIVEEILQSYIKAIDKFSGDETQFQFDPYRKLGTIRSASGGFVRLTPFHPLMLAYGLRLANWRDQLKAQGLTGGFRSERFKYQFSPVGFSPYRWNKSGTELLSGQPIGNNHFWAQYTPIEGPSSKTPSYMNEVISDKFKAFADAFSLLFSLHPQREIDVNLINMGDLEPVIEGLYHFYDYVSSRRDLHVPRVNLRIYGGRGQGRGLDRFFAVDQRDAGLRDNLSAHGGSEIIDTMERNVTYIRAGKKFNEETAKPAHLTLFRGILNERSGSVSVESFPAGTRLDALLPRDRIKVESDGTQIKSTSAVAIDPDSTNLTEQIASRVNALEASMLTQEFVKDRTPSKVISSDSQTNLPLIWNTSLWVLHVEPRVGIDFYIKSRAVGAGPDESTLLIHYSDQYDGTSPGYDVITTTKKRDPYVEGLNQALNEVTGLDELDANTVLKRLVAVDGELALDIQKAGGKEAIELLGLVGGLAIVSEILSRQFPDHAWLPFDIKELARHDREYRRREEGLLQFWDDDPASDDLCFVGVPEGDEFSELPLKLWPVETKGGSSDVSKGVTQVQNALRNHSKTFNPDGAWADTSILKSEFGDFLLRLSDRMLNYDAITPEKYESIQAKDEYLVNANYSIEFLEDIRGAMGDVVRISPKTGMPEVRHEENVRIIECPAESLQLINPKRSGREIHKDFQWNWVEYAPEPDIAVSAAQEDDTDEGVRPVRQPEGDSDEVEDEIQSRETPPSPDIDRTEGDLEVPVDRETDPIETETVAQPEEGDSKTSVDRQKLITRLSKSPETTLNIDVTRLTSELKKQFQSLGVAIHRPNPSDVSIGPRKIGVNVRPKEGQKIESIMNSLNSISVHLEASGNITGILNPAAGAIRLEIPHGEPRDIYLREGFEKMEDKLQEPLHIPLGVNTENEHKTLDLLKEHHALVGGATGSGKSNFLSGVICSLSFWHQPDLVRLSLLDPKGIDFGRFQKLPQVDTYLDDPNSCVRYLLNILDSELEERKKFLQESSVASVQQYNELADEQDREKIPYRVIIIDEFADLMMSLQEDKAQLEEAVSRLAQIGRALGYSIILATQRPDHEVVSGQIKTNFNCRISFELPTKTDSRVILDQNGAEDLMGAGDMIAITGAGDEYHLQGYHLIPQDAVTLLEALGESK